MSLSPSALLHQPLCWQRCIHGLLLHLHSKILKCTLKSSTSTLYGMQLPHNAILYFTDFCTKRYFCFITPQCREADLFPPLFLNHFFQLLPNVFVDSRLQFRRHVCVYVIFFLLHIFVWISYLASAIYTTLQAFCSKFSTCFSVLFFPLLDVKVACYLHVSCLLIHPTAGFIPPQLNTK